MPQSYLASPFHSDILGITMELWSLIIIVALIVISTLVLALIVRRSRVVPSDDRGFSLLNQNVQGMRRDWPKKINNNNCGIGRN